MATSLLKIPVDAEGIEIGSDRVEALLSHLMRCFRGNMRCHKVSNHCGGIRGRHCGSLFLSFQVAAFFFLVEASKFSLAKSRSVGFGAMICYPGAMIKTLGAIVPSLIFPFASFIGNSQWCLTFPRRIVWILLGGRQ